MWWLSFADDTGFLAACIVPGDSMIDAVRTAWASGCNPGGEAMGLEIEQAHVDKIDPKWIGRALTRKETEEFDREMAERINEDG